MILPVAVLGAAAAAAVTFCSGRNMVQTFLLVQKHGVAAVIENTADAHSPTILHQLERLLNASNGNNDGALQGADCSSSSSEILVNYIKSLKRKESLQLFLSSQPPTNMSSIYGDWNGVLLENGGTVLTSITRFLTNALFGQGHVWNGKAFFVADSRQGINRFHTATATDAASTNNNNAEKRQHRFDYAIAPSRLESAVRRFGVGGSIAMKNSLPLSSSLTLVYKQYQSPLSLWRTMVDELRLVSLPSSTISDDCEMLIGMGSMAWSGGMLNASPFLLWRDKAIK
jgi:hypothetical protein